MSRHPVHSRPAARARQRARPHARSTTIGVALLALVTVLPFAAGSAQGGSPASRVVTPRRFPADSFWTREWFRGSTKDPELFTEPRQVVAVGDLVLVLDLGLREVTGFDARTGEQRMQLSARGEGPGEFKRPAQLVAVESGFAVLDLATARLSAFDARGRFAWDVPLPEAGGTEGVCVQRGGRVITKTPGSNDALLTTDSSGRTRAKRSLPWPDPGQRSSALAGYVAGPAADGSCVFARRFGSEWLVIPLTGALARKPYVSEHPEATIVVKNGPKRRSGPEVTFVRTQFENAVAAVSGVMMRGDTVIVRGGPAERDGYRLLDYYVLPSGRYVYSRRLPTIFIATAAGANGTFYGTSIGEESGALIALRPTAVRPTPRAPGARKAPAPPAPPATVPPAAVPPDQPGS